MTAAFGKDIPKVYRKKYKHPAYWLLLVIVVIFWSLPLATIGCFCCLTVILAPVGAVLLLAAAMPITAIISKMAGA